MSEIVLEVQDQGEIELTTQDEEGLELTAEERAIIEAISPVVTFERVTGGAVVTVEDIDGVKTVNLYDGEDGDDGVSIQSVQLNDDYTLTIYFSNGQSVTTTSIRGAQGEQGQQGVPGTSAYVWIRYAANQPEQDSDMKTTPDDWIGIYSGASATAPTTYTSYTWYRFKGETGPHDVHEYDTASLFPATGETEKIYIAKDTNVTYRWNGSGYTAIGSALELGETSSTAYRGDRGKAAYDHATDANRLTSAQESGLYKIATTNEGHIASATAAAKSDITALGIPSSDTVAAAYATTIYNTTSGATYRILTLQADFTGYKLRNNNLFPLIVKSDLTFTYSSNFQYNYARLQVNNTAAQYIIFDSNESTNYTSDITLQAGVYWVYYNNSKYYLRRNSFTVGSINGNLVGNAISKDVDTSISSGSTSTNLPTSEAVATFVSGQIDNALKTTLRDIPITVTVNDWELSNGVYTAEFDSEYITGSSKEITIFDSTYRTYARDDIIISKQTGGGGLVLTTGVIPTGTISGTIYAIDTDDGKVAVVMEETTVPIANGGTGQSTLAGAQDALGITEINNQMANHDIIWTSPVITLGTQITWTSTNISEEIKQAGLYLVELIRINNSIETVAHTMFLTGYDLLVDKNSPVIFWSNEIGTASKTIYVAGAESSGKFSYYVGANATVGVVASIKIQVRKVIA